MSWERRNVQQARPYYLRAKRVGGRVRKEYFGRGERAEAAAAADALAREQRQAERNQVKKLERMLLAAEASLKDFDDAVVLITHAILFSAGYHRVNYQWRLRRD